jgi:GNAT superfamily N-acetyltransferase
MAACSHARVRPEAELARPSAADSRAVAETLARAFGDYPAFAYIAPEQHTRARLVDFVFRGLADGFAEVPGARVVVRRCASCDGVVAASVIMPALARGRAAGKGAAEVPEWALLKHGLAELPLRFGPALTARTLLVLLSIDSALCRIGALLGPHVYQDYLCVAPEVQGKGLGGALLDVAGAQGDLVVLQTFSPPARRLYLRHGYRDLGWEWNGSTTWWMARRVGDTALPSPDVAAALLLQAGPGPEPFPAAGWAAPGGPCRAEALSRRRHELALTLVVAVLLTPAALLLAPLAWLWRALRPAFAV